MTFTTRSAATFESFCTMPDGQRISTSSADLFEPRRKCSGPALDEAYPALVAINCVSRKLAQAVSFIGARRKNIARNAPGFFQGVRRG